jgi:hypothetical protein
MEQFVLARQTKDTQGAQVEWGPVEVEKTDLKAQKQALRREKEALRICKKITSAISCHNYFGCG